MLLKQEIPEEDLKLILENFDLGKIIFIEPVLTSGNISYIITTNIEKYLLRLCPDKGPRFRSNSEIDVEIELLHYLKKRDFPVLIPFKDKSGNEVISFKNHNGYIREFSNHNSKEEPSLNHIKEVGRILGQFHLLTEKFNTKNKREHLFDLNSTKEYFKENINCILNSNFKNKEKFVSKINSVLLSMSFPDNLPQGIIHEDLGKRHILWDKEKIVAIIDFDRSYYGKLLLDIGQSCRGWCFEDNWAKWNNEKFKSLIKGYNEKRKITELEKKFLIDAIKFAIVERAISFCLRFLRLTNDHKDEDYALHSVLEESLLDILDKNKEDIKRILKDI